MSSKWDEDTKRTHLKRCLDRAFDDLKTLDQEVQSYIQNPSTLDLKGRRHLRVAYHDAMWLDQGARTELYGQGQGTLSKESRDNRQRRLKERLDNFDRMVAIGSEEAEKRHREWEEEQRLRKLLGESDSEKERSHHSESKYGQSDDHHHGRR